MMALSGVRSSWLIVGEEAALRDVGVLGRRAGRLELGRAQPVLGDVARDRDHRAIHAVRPGARLDPVRPHLDPDHPQARPAAESRRRGRRNLPDMDAELHGDRARARGGVADRLEEGRPVRHVDPREQAATLERAGWRADQLGGGGVRLQDVAAVIVPRDEVVDRLQEGAVVAVAPARRRPASNVEAGGRHRVDRAAGERRDRDGPDRGRAGPGRAREEAGMFEHRNGQDAEGSQGARRGAPRREAETAASSGTANSATSAADARPPEADATQTISPARAAEDTACAAASEPVRPRTKAAPTGRTRQAIAVASAGDGTPRQRRYGTRPASARPPSVRRAAMKPACRARSSGSVHAVSWTSRDSRCPIAEGKPTLRKSDRDGGDRASLAFEGSCQNRFKRTLSAPDAPGEAAAVTGSAPAEPPPGPRSPIRKSDARARDRTAGPAVRQRLVHAVDRSAPTGRADRTRAPAAHARHRSPGRAGEPI